jgi:cobyrinic acid a,c-diamide synthase
LHRLQVDDLCAPEGRLGLACPSPGRAAYLDRLAQLAEAHVDLDALLRMAAEATAAASQPLQQLPRLLPPAGGPCVRLAVAHDEAFCLYYSECVLDLHGLHWLSGLQAYLAMTEPVIPAEGQLTSNHELLPAVC